MEFQEYFTEQVLLYKNSWLLLIRKYETNKVAINLYVYV